MCGIAGYWGNKFLPEKLILKTLSTMSNRGPDSQRFCNISLQNKEQIYLLHSRLDIIDLNSRSNQPFQSDGNIIIFNGEIYNYLEIRQKLQNKGIKFKTESDTEVVLKSYNYLGHKCLDSFEGMWSFAIYDKKRKGIFLSRDRFSEKPLYYYQKNNELYFASQTSFIFSLLDKSPDINVQQLKKYMIYGYKSLYKDNNTFFKNIYEFDPGSYCFISNNKKIIKKKYWNINLNKKLCNKASYDEIVSNVRNKLFKSIELRLRSDVSIAFSLSGGLDSSTLISIASKVFNYKCKAFSIVDYDFRYNEAENIKSNIKDLKCDYSFIRIRKQNYFKYLTKLINYHNSPLATPTSLISSLIFKKASEQNFKVLITGTAADEIFSGYYDHYLQFFYEIKKLKKLKNEVYLWEKYIKKNVRNKYFQAFNLYLKNKNFRNHIFDNFNYNNKFFKKKLEYNFFEKVFSKSLMKNRMLNELFYENTPVILNQEDLNAMYFSVENRSPYLDTSLVEYCFSIPREHLINNGFSKNILREATKGILNEKVRVDRIKKGFNTSVSSILDFKDKFFLNNILNKASPIYDIVDYNKIRKLFKLNFYPNNISKFLFSFINSKLFLDQQ